MSYAAISPVISRIQSIQTRMGVPSDLQIGATADADDFASQLSAAFADSSLTTGSATTTGAATGSTTAGQPTGFAPMAQDVPGVSGGGTTASLPTSYAVLTSSLTGISGLGGVGASNPYGALGTGGSGATTPFDAQFAAAGERYGVPADLLSAVGWVESRYQIDAVSSAGAQGVMQLMPFVADELGVDAFDPNQAIDGAARLLKSHYDRFGNWDLALAAYNAGAGAVSRAGNTIPSPGVAEYVRRVNERMMST